MSYECFRDALLPLKESSKQAVANADRDSFDDVKTYLHIERDVERELETILKQVAGSDRGALVLVCGNVGDGKSHLISRLRQKHLGLLAHMRVFDDATESMSPTKSNIEQLRENLAAYSDANLASCREQTLLAINLGILNNFIVEDRSGEFSQLKTYVEQMKILEVGEIEDNAYNENSSFQFVNFTDHHLFHLTKDGPVSPIIEVALEKVASSLPGNPFYSAFESRCCECHSNCPVRTNYELLQQEAIRKKIAGLLIQCVVRHHHIISVRALYNFIFDLIVPVEMNGRSFDEINWLLQQQTAQGYFRNVFVNSLFEHPEVSRIFEHLYYIDPALKRSSMLDEQIIQLVTLEDASSLLQDMELPPPLKHSLTELVTSSSDDDQKLIVNSFVRAKFFTEKTDVTALFEEGAYADFMRLLYAWYSGDRIPLKEVYRLFQQACVCWCGRSPDGEMPVDLGNYQLEYRLSERVDIKPAGVPKGMTAGDVIRKFNYVLPLEFMSAADPASIPLQVDCRLYEMARKVESGYCANLVDKSNYVAFSSFVTAVMKSGELGQRLRITESETGRHFVLETGFFGDFTFRSM